MEVSSRVERPGLLRSALGNGLAHGRLTAAAVVAAYFGVLDAGGGYRSWGRLGVPPMSTKANLWFPDLRNVTTAWDCTRRGIVVLPINPCDPWQRPTNYPRIWLIPSALGLTERSTFALGLVVVGVFLLAALAVLPRAAGPGAGLLYGLALCSPAVMLGIQRGNVDLVVVTLVVAAVLVPTDRLAGTAAAASLLLLASVLKLFPMFAVGVFVRRGRRAALVAAAVVMGVVGVYAVATRGNLRAIYRAVPQTDDTSFGLHRFGDWMSAALAHRFSTVACDVAVVAVLLVGVLVARRRLRARLGEDGAPGAARDLDLFWAGACIYVGSYALFRSFDYRLVFVLLTVPQLFHWAASRRWIAIATAAALFGTLWLDVSWNGVPVVDGTLAALRHVSTLPVAVGCQLLLFAGLVAGLVATAPELIPCLRQDGLARPDLQRNGLR